MEKKAKKRVREISCFFIAPRREFAPAGCACPPTPFSTNTSTLVHYLIEPILG